MVPLSNARPVSSCLWPTRTIPGQTTKPFLSLLSLFLSVTSQYQQHNLVPGRTTCPGSGPFSCNHRFKCFSPFLNNNYRQLKSTLWLDNHTNIKKIVFCFVGIGVLFLVVTKKKHGGHIFEILCWKKCPPTNAKCPGKSFLSF